MDPRLWEVIAKNDTPTFISLVRENEQILEQETDASSTLLHLASRFGNIEIAMEIVKLRPDLVAAVNNKLETPLHEACRHGNAEILLLFLQTSPWAACICKLNGENQTPLFIACSNGHLNVVKLLLNQPWLLGLEEDGTDLNSLHVAVSRGHTDIVGELLKVCPYLAQMVDKKGYLPLHYACAKGQIEITKMLLSLGPDLALHYNNSGYTPLHLAAMTGKTAILEQFMSMDPSSFQILTKGGSTSEILHLKDMLKKSEDKTSRGLSSGRPEIEEINPQPITPDSPTSQIGEQFDKLILERNSSFIEQGDILMSTPLSNEISVKMDHLQKSIGGNIENPGNEPSKSVSTSVKTRSSSNNLRRHKHLSDRHREKLRELYQKGHNKQHEMYREALQNARNTIILVAVLIATVTFTAGLSPPGGVYQDGPLKGKSILGRTTSFKVFLISNNIALFTSLSIVIILVSIIPFRRKQLMRLLVVAHKVMWVAVSFMATAYVAGTWVITPQGQQGTSWVLEALLSVCCGTLGSVFVFMGVMLGKHWLRKLKYRKEKRERMQSASNIGSKNKMQSASNIGSKNKTNSSNSDVSTQVNSGYHLY